MLEEMKQNDLERQHRKEQYHQQQKQTKRRQIDDFLQEIKERYFALYTQFIGLIPFLESHYHPTSKNSGQQRDLLTMVIPVRQIFMLGISLPPSQNSFWRKNSANLAKCIRSRLCGHGRKMNDCVDGFVDLSVFLRAKMPMKHVSH